MLIRFSTVMGIFFFVEGTIPGCHGPTGIQQVPCGSVQLLFQVSFSICQICWIPGPLERSGSPSFQTCYYHGFGTGPQADVTAGNKTHLQFTTIHDRKITFLIVAPVKERFDRSEGQSGAYDVASPCLVNSPCMRWLPSFSSFYAYYTL